MKIYQDMNKKLYGDSLVCTRCDKEIIGEMALLHYCWHSKKTRHPSLAEILCVRCIKHKNKHYDVEESYPVICLPENKRPKGLSEWIHLRCELKDSRNISTFDAANLQSEKTIDRTRYAGRESWQGASIGLKPEDVKQVTSDEVKKILYDEVE